jgi:hypothetical protein
MTMRGPFDYDGTLSEDGITALVWSIAPESTGLDNLSRDSDGTYTVEAIEALRWALDLAEQGPRIELDPDIIQWRRSEANLQLARDEIQRLLGVEPVNAES